MPAKYVEKKLSIPLHCPTCKIHVAMPIEGQLSQVMTHVDEDESFSWEEGPTYQLLLCPACGAVILLKFNYHSHWDERYDPTILYPPSEQGLSGLPERVAKAYEAANKVKSIDPNAYAVLLRRTLEIICADRKASGKKLYDQLLDLGKRGEIPTNLVEVAHGLRKLGNIGAHASEGDLTSAQIPYLDRLARAIIEYIYNAPLLVGLVEKELARLKGDASVVENDVD